MPIIDLTPLREGGAAGKAAVAADIKRCVAFLWVCFWMEASNQASLPPPGGSDHLFVCIHRPPSSHTCTYITWSPQKQQRLRVRRVLHRHVTRRPTGGACVFQSISQSKRRRRAYPTHQHTHSVCTIWNPPLPFSPSPNTLCVYISIINYQSGHRPRLGPSARVFRPAGGGQGGLGADGRQVRPRRVVRSDQPGQTVCIQAHRHTPTPKNHPSTTTK